MPSPTAVSVVLCTWNRSERLGQSLRSLAGQTGVSPKDIEVIVVDNNSTDDTRAVVEALASDWPLGRLRYAFEARQGKQFALNCGLGLARHPVLAFTDDDILFPTDWLQRIAALFASPAVELAGGRTLVSWPAGGRPPWYADDMLAIVGGVDLGDLRLNPAPVEYAPGGANLIARRSLFDRVGGYSETHFRHMDFEFGQRCQRAGACVVYEPSIQVHAPVDEQILTRRYFRRWAFKAGISPGTEACAIQPGFPTVPRWIYRQLLEDACFAALLSYWNPPPYAFSRELRFWRALGTVANAWHAWLRPRSHAQWVERYSQKKNNLY